MPRNLLLILILGLIAGCIQPPLNSKGSTRAKHFLTINVTGLDTGKSFSIVNDANQVKTITSNTQFSFTKKYKSTEAYTLAITTQPTLQNCTLGSSAGNFAKSSLTININCNDKIFSIGGTASGVIGTLSLIINGIESKNITANGSYTFTSKLATGDTYSISATAPTGQSCVVSNGTGTMGSSNISNVNIVCSNFSYRIGGSISGLSGSVVLFNSVTGESLTVSSATTFQFINTTPNGSIYNVSVSSNPTGQSCVVSNGSGTVSGSDVSTISVTCTNQNFTIGGTVFDLNSGQSAVLSLNGGVGTATVSGGSTSYNFSTSISTGTSYVVAITTQPTSQTCTLQNPTGTVAGSNISNVHLLCGDNHTVGGSISNLGSGETLGIQIDSNTAESISNASSYTFTSTISEGSTYTATITSNPGGKECVFQSNSSTTITQTMSTSDVTNLNITCNNKQYTISGVVSGQTGSLSAILNSTVETLSVNTTTSSFSFASTVAHGSGYNITTSDPAGQTCTVANGAGTINAANVSNVGITCINNSHSVTGSITGLTAAKTVVLTLSNITSSTSTDTTIVGTGAPVAISFTNTIDNNSSYAVTVKTQPVGQSCSVDTAGTGTIAAANITTLAVSCLDTYALSGQITGTYATGSYSLVLTTESTSETLTVATPTSSYSFSTQIRHNMGYNISLTAPAGHSATFTNANETVLATVGPIADVSNLDVTSSLLTYSISGTISGGNGNTMTITNGADSVTLTSSLTGFTVSTIVDHNSSFDVDIPATGHPEGQECILTGDSGTISASDVTNVGITCSTSSHTISGTISNFFADDDGSTTRTLELTNSVSGEVITINEGSTSFSFTTKAAYSGSYNVTVSGQPDNQSCEISGSTGVDASITNPDLDIAGPSGKVTSIIVNCFVDVEAKYSAASNWNDYIRTSDTDTACDGSETGFTGCLHGGERRKIVTSYTACSNLTIIDNLGAFDWTCEVESSKATFTSTLKDSKGLSSLISTSHAWFDNFVTISTITPSAVIATSKAQAWWSNIIETLTINSANAIGLGQQGRIYIHSSTAATAGYNIANDKVSLLIPNGSVLNFNSTTNCNATGGMATPTQDCAVASDSKNFIWIEGAIDTGTGTDQGIYLNGTTYGTVRNSKITDFSYGIRLLGASNNRIHSSKVSGSTNDGILLETNSDTNLLKLISSSRNGADGISFSASSSNSLVLLKSYNNVDDGISFLSLSNSNTGQGLITTNNNQQGIEVNASTSNTLSAISSIQNGSDGILITATANSTSIINAVSVNNGSDGIEIASSDNALVTQLTTSDNVSFGINLNNTSSNKFSGNNVFFSAVSCDVTGANTDPGLVDATCASQGASSDGNLNNTTFVAALADDFLGKVTAADTANTSDTLGVAAFANGNDWLDFDNFFRTWGEHSAADAFPNANHRSNCTAGNCRIWDWRLATQIDANKIILQTSGDASAINDAFTASVACPTQVNGNQTLTDLSANSFMKNAIEIIDDTIGDNDGFCEASEACLYTPNFGAYQGSVEILNDSIGDDDGLCEVGEACSYTSETLKNQTQSCNFSSAAGLSGITIYGFPTNGE